MKIKSFDTTYIEKRNYIEVTVYTGYSTENGTNIVYGNKKDKFKIKKPTKKELIKLNKKKKSIK